MVGVLMDYCRNVISVMERGIEGRTNFGRPIDNFYGLELHGTALVDVSKLQKKRPTGARIFISETAEKRLPKDQGPNISKSVQLKKNLEGGYETLPGHPLSFDVLRDQCGNLEFFFHDDGIRSLHDCYYCLLCLSKPVDDRLFDHYIWTISSRTNRIGKSELIRLVNKVSFDETDVDSDTILNAVSSVFDRYKPL